MKQGHLSAAELADIRDDFEGYFDEEVPPARWIGKLLTHIHALEQDLIKIRSSVDDMNAHIVENRDNGAFLVGYLATRLGSLQMYMELRNLGLTQTPPVPEPPPPDALPQNDEQP